MLSSKASMSDSSGNKSTPATPRVNKNGRMGSAKVDFDLPSPQQNSTRSPKSVNSNQTGDRRSPRNITSLDAKKAPNFSEQPRLSKGSELQAQLALVQEDLKKVKEKLASEEKEKFEALEELKEAKKAVDIANEKLEDALLSQKLAKESSELDKFRADEVEQSAIEAAQKKEEEWIKELGDVRNQQAVDAAALLSVSQELQRVKQELEMTTDAKDTALSHADNAMKISEINVVKVEMLSKEISDMKTLLESEFDRHAKEMAEVISKFDSEADVLKHELGKAKASEEKLIDTEALVKELEIQVLNLRMAESNTLGVTDEQKKKVELLESQLEKTRQSESTLNHSLVSMKKQLEERVVAFNDAKSEINSLNAKVEILEFEVCRHKDDLKESNLKLDLSQQKRSSLEKKAEALKSEVQKMEELKALALNNEKDACLNVESLTHENNRLAVELEFAREESGKTKKAIDKLISALHEISMETRDAQERLLIKQTQLDNASAEAEELKSALKIAQEKHELILDQAKYEIICLKKDVEKSKAEVRDLRAELDLKEHSLLSVTKKSEEEIAAIKLQKNNAVVTLERLKDETKTAEKEASLLKNKMKLVETELSVAKEAMEEVMAETINLNERMLNKENQLQSIIQENDELRIRDAAASEKIAELSNLLAELTACEINENGDVGRNGENGENGERYDSYKESDLLLLVTEGMQEVVTEAKTEEASESGSRIERSEETLKKEPKLVEMDKANGNDTENRDGHENFVKEELSEGVKVIDKQLTLEKDYTESAEDETDSKLECLDHPKGDNVRNGSNNLSPEKQQPQQLLKKKKPLLQKFGSMLKKKSNPK